MITTTTRQCHAETRPPHRQWGTPKPHCETPATFEDTDGTWWCPRHQPGPTDYFEADDVISDDDRECPGHYDGPLPTDCDGSCTGYGPTRVARTTATLDVAEAKRAFDTARDRYEQAVAALQDAYCDHPDVDGCVCACGAFVPPTEQQAATDDHYRVRYADWDDARSTPNATHSVYAVWRRHHLYNADRKTGTYTP